MKVTTKSQLVLFSAFFLLSVLSLFLSLVVKWQTTSLSDNKFLTVPLLISALSAHSLHQPKSRNLIQLENIFVVFGSVFLFQPQGAVSLSTQSDEIRNLMLLKRRLHEINPSESDEHQHSKSRAVLGGSSKVKSLRSQLTNKEKKLSRKEELSNRILEEIESLDPLKCLPKALCSLSAQPADLITHSSDPGQGLSEQEKKNNDVVNEYLELMKTIITMEPQSKRQEKNRIITPPKSQLEKPPKAETKENDEDEYDTSDDEDEEGEDGDDENNDDFEENEEEEVSNEHEHQQESKRRPVSIIRPNNFRHNPPAIPKPPRPTLSHSNEWHYNEKHKIRNMIAATEDPYALGNTDLLYPDYEHKPRPHRRPPPPPPMRDTRHGFNNYGHGNKNKRKNQNEKPPVSYSQQYHYMSAPGPPAPANVHGGYQTQGYDDYHHEPPYQASITEYQSAFTSMMYYYMPSFVKKIIDFVMPVFTFEYSPIEGTPPNIFKDDPFFDGFKKKQGTFDVGYGRSLSGNVPIAKASTVIERRSGRSLDDIMVDARDRFAGALEVGQTFKNVRKCQAVYSTCPFKHTQIVEMINALKEKMQLQKFVYNKISRFAQKNQAPQQAEDRNMDLSKPAFSSLSKEKQNQGSKENSASLSKEDVISKILKRKWDTDITTIKPSTTTDSNSYSKISFSHEQNFQRKPLVIRNIHNILRTGLHHSSETDSDSPTKQITILRDKTGHNDNGEDLKSVHQGSKTYNDKEFMSRSTEYSDSVESIEDLLAVANSHKSLVQKYQQLVQQQQSSKNSNSKYVVNKAGKSNDTPPVTSTTEAPSFFQTFVSFFKN